MKIHPITVKQVLTETSKDIAPNERYQNQKFQLQKESDQLQFEMKKLKEEKISFA